MVDSGSQPAATDPTPDSRGGQVLDAVLQAAVSFWRIARNSVRKFRDDRCFAHAASLSYATLVALVPMSVLAFTFFTAFERYDELRNRAEEAIFTYVVPSVGEQLVSLLDQVSQNMQRLSLPGLLLFLFASTLLLNSLETSFNAIWGIRRSRSYVAKLLTSWAILTLVPVLLAGGSVLADQFGVQERLADWVRNASTFLFTMAAFTLMLHVLPYTRTRIFASMTGGLLGAALWLGSRSLFVTYVMHVSEVRTALGNALATIALFLLWIYFSWLVVLLSAQLAYAIQHYRAGEAKRAAATADPALRTFRLVLVLVEIARRFGKARADEVYAGSIAEAIGLRPEQVQPLVEELLALQLVYRTESGGLVPAHPPDGVDLAEVVRRARADLLAAPTEPNGGVAGKLARLFGAASDETLAHLEGHSLADLVAVADTDRDQR